MKYIAMIMGVAVILFIIGYLIRGKTDILHHGGGKSINIKDTAPTNLTTQFATFAGGCFWCMQPSFDELTGVIQTRVGFAGGDKQTATYEQVSAGGTDHRESLQVEFDPLIISYAQLLENFRKQIDPTDPDGQFADKGFQYTSAIFTHDSDQKKLAEQSKMILEESKRYDKPIATQIINYTTFFPAEEYHQQYYRKSWLRYKTYKTLSGREARVHKQEDLHLSGMTEKTSLQNGGVVQSKDTLLWGGEPQRVKPSQEQLQKTLTPLQYKVTQEAGTERPFDNAFRDNHHLGIYVDIVSGEPLFSSSDKYDSGTGRPSFTKPISEDAIITHEDRTLRSTRTEVKSRYADSHLGHVFTDGPKEKGGLRYCMNSAAMAFIPLEEMDKRGYSKWKDLIVMP